jgi:hypothetical protein
VLSDASVTLYTYNEWVEMGQIKKERKEERKFVLIMGQIII